MNLVRQARVLLLDFDGPVCDLFAAAERGPAVAARISAATDLALPPAVVKKPTTITILDFATSVDDENARRIEAALTGYELESAATAVPTPGAAELIAHARRSGRPVVIVSNNAVTAVQSYLRAHGLADDIGAIHARTGDTLRLLKPHPHLLQAALATSQTPPEQAVFVGDQESDVIAARAANVPVIGYVAPGMTGRLGVARPDAVIESMTELAAGLTVPRAVGNVDPP